MKYKRTVPAHVELRETITRTTCDICGLDVDHASKGCFDFSEVTIYARIGEVYPESDFRTLHTIDLCPPCFENKLMPAVESLGAKWQSRDADESALEHAQWENVDPLSASEYKLVKAIHIAPYPPTAAELLAFGFTRHDIDKLPELVDRSVLECMAGRYRLTTKGKDISCG